jgi:hypothetical protein
MIDVIYNTYNWHCHPEHPQIYGDISITCILQDDTAQVTIFGTIVLYFVKGEDYGDSKDNN